MVINSFSTVAVNVTLKKLVENVGFPKFKIIRNNKIFLFKQVFKIIVVNKSI